MEYNCEAIDLVRMKGHGGRVFNIGGCNEWTNLEVAKAILRMMRKPEELIHFVEDRPGHDRRYRVDSSKVKALGWRPRHGFAETLQRTVEWYRRGDWWKPLIARAGNDEDLGALRPWGRRRPWGTFAHPSLRYIYSPPLADTESLRD